MQKVWQRINWWLIASMLGLAFLGPLVCEWLGVQAVFKIIGLYFVLNMTFSLYLGHYLRQHGAFWWFLAGWPLLFGLATWFGLVSAYYGYALAILYGLLELVTYTSGQESEPDIASQIPVDGGYHSI
ncbi:hypothetical protein [Weissella halotolerans]|uniref:Uncharacterized protein n=1 Tax=Weissella halotolerans DSM 20190 TaxID=1123500 RepID=A0A0R2FTR0_9LACO|nr:hypothetical protein [Weissella halotolerans]KRN31761.1 hypothetical protein IV68_GL001018 [Weissella halotolerans DSM 20190]